MAANAIVVVRMLNAKIRKDLVIFLFFFDVLGILLLIFD